MALKDAAGWNQTPGDLARFLDLAPQGCFKAERQGALAGTAVVFDFDGAAWVAMMLVREELRGRGIGRALMEHCLESCRRRGLDRVRLDATDSGLPLYRACGFTADWRIGLARGFPDGREARGPSAEVRRIEPADAGEISALDRQAGGVDRRELIRRLAAEFPRYGFRLRRGRGAVLFRPGRHSWTVGPLLAESREEAGLLLGAAVGEIRSEGGNRSVLLSLPMEHPASLDLCAEWGFEAAPRLTRMHIGGELPGPSGLLYALSGPEKG